MDSLDFSEEEIEEQLAVLGYRNIPKHRLQKFKQDLDELILHGELRHLASPPQNSSTKPLKPAATQPSPPAFIKEKVSHCFGDGFFLHGNKSDHDRQVLTVCQNRDYRRGEGLPDSYAQHSVAPKLPLDPGAPSRLQVEAEPDDTLDTPLGDSYVLSPDTQGRRLIKRKVLRKHGGQSLVHEESIYSEDSASTDHTHLNMYKMYNAQSDDDDKNSLYSSFWSDGEREDEEEHEEEVQLEPVVSKGGSEPAKESLQEASEEEKPELNLCDKSEKSSEDGSNDTDDDDDDEEKEAQIAQVVCKEGFKSSEEEKPEMYSCDESEKSSEDGSNDTDDDEDDEEKEEKAQIAQVICKEGFKSSEDEKPEMYSCDESEESSEGGGDDTDGDKEEEDDEKEQEEVQMKPTVGKVGSRPSEESLTGASEEEKRRSEVSSEDGGDDTEEEEEEEEEDPEEDPEKDEDVVQTEPVVTKVGSRPAEEYLQQGLEEEEPEMVTGDKRKESSEDGSIDADDDEKEPEVEEDEDEDEEEDESCDSPAPSLMTSGYGTYRPEEQDGGDLRDDHSGAALEDEDSRGDLSENGGDEDDGRSLYSFNGTDVDPADQDDSETRPPSSLADGEPETLATPAGGDDGLHEEVDVPHRNAEDETEECEEATVLTSEEQQAVTHEKDVEEGGGDGEGKQDEEVDLQELESSDESSANGDIKFIDSKVDFSQMTYEEMCEGWEGNLRRKRDAANSLEERLADLRLSTSPQRDAETENVDAASRSDSRSSEVSVGAFDSYFRSVTRTQSDVGVRPKPKSFIRPAMSQQTVKKTDPVAKYFQYKQLWEMFKLPGEREHRALRLEIKERLAYQPPPPKPRRVYVPNTYVVPTEKKRSALRWEIRNDLANGLVPYKVSYRF